MWVRKDLRYQGQSSALLKVFIQMLLSTEGQGLLGGYGFYKLPSWMLDFSRSTVDYLLVDADAKAFSFEVRIGPMQVFTSS